MDRHKKRKKTQKLARHRSGGLSRVGNRSFLRLLVFLVAIRPSFWIEFGRIYTVGWFGNFLVTSIQQAAMTRADVPEIERRDFSLYVDEFQNFTTGSFASVLSEARKYRLSLIVAHQYLTQLDEPTANAVFGNVGSIVTFQVGSDDAERLAEQLGKYPGQLTPKTSPASPNTPPASAS